MKKSDNIPSTTATGNPDDLRWYALKVFFNRVFSTRDLISKFITESYIPLKSEIVEHNGQRRKVTRPMVSSLLFVKAAPDAMRAIRPVIEGKAMIYTRQSLSGTEPAPIPDSEMELFKFVTSEGHEGVEWLGADSPRYHQGDLVRVTGGPFQGAVGRIVRIKANRRLIVTIQGLCAVATGFIPGVFLEKIGQE